MAARREAQAGLHVDAVVPDRAQRVQAALPVSGVAERWAGGQPPPPVRGGHELRLYGDPIRNAIRQLARRLQFRPEGLHIGRTRHAGLLVTSGWRGTEPCDVLHRMEADEICRLGAGATTVGIDSDLERRRRATGEWCAVPVPAAPAQGAHVEHGCRAGADEVVSTLRPLPPGHRVHPDASVGKSGDLVDGVAHRVRRRHKAGEVEQEVRLASRPAEDAVLHVQAVHVARGTRRGEAANARHASRRQTPLRSWTASPRTTA